MYRWPAPLKLVKLGEAAEVVGVPPDVVVVGEVELDADILVLGEVLKVEVDEEFDTAG
jgi:hypothetical protein